MTPRKGTAFGVVVGRYTHESHFDTKPEASEETRPFLGRVVREGGFFPQKSLFQSPSPCDSRPMARKSEPVVPLSLSGCEALRLGTSRFVLLRLE